MSRPILKDIAAVAVGSATLVGLGWLIAGLMVTP